MNYFDKYLNFYTGENRRAMFLTLCVFIEAVRDNDINKLRSTLTENVIADLSINGHHEGIDDVANALMWPGETMDIKRITLNSYISRSHKNMGQMSVYTQCIYAKEDESNVFPFMFGGQYMNSMIKENDTWKFSHIRYDLCYEAGNNFYVKDKWNLMDYNVLYGHKTMINPELEAPWIVIPYDDEPISDKESVFELEYRNNIGMDGGAFNLSHEIFSDDIFLNYSHRKKINKNYPSSIDGDFYGRKDAINYFKAKQHKEARLQHIVAMAELQFNEDKTAAKAYMIRSEFHRTNNHIFNKTTIHKQPLTAIHEIDAVKEDGVWKMKRMAYYPIMEWQDMNDDCIFFDDYIVDQTNWIRIKKKLNLK